jgi:primosomal protein N' (replication factor Y)
MSAAFAMLSRMDIAKTIARVVVDVPARALSDPFDYRVPPALAAEVSVGCPVVVPFGPRHCLGYVVSLEQSSAFDDRLRDLEGVVGAPVFDEHAITHARWIAREYLAPLSESLKLFLPPGGAPRVHAEPGGGWTLVGRQMSPTSDRLVTLTGDHRPRSNAVVQRAVLAALEAGPVTVAELAAEVRGAAAAVRTLERAGAVSVSDRRRYRRPGGPNPQSTRHPHTDEQAQAITRILAMVESGGGVALLDGITGSGKTEVYLSAIEHVLAEGRSAIVLVPEISLTPQTVGRFRARLGGDVAVIHSRLSAGERFDQWQLALSGQVRVVVGARSALFAPVRDLALVIIDEEHEPSYKQGQSPRYHTRDVAEHICAVRGAVLVLGSATPSLETMTLADEGVYERLPLTRRVGGGSPAPIEVVDMAREFAEGHRSIYSRSLTQHLRSVAERGEKAVLFLNRRGFASFLLCRECGFVPTCESCSVSLTYHEDIASLQCHHCGAARPVPPTCPRCGSAYLRRFGAGTQRAETDLHTLLPGLPVIRMDADTTARKGGHEQTLRSFEALESGVLLGTQMIAKGLDYPEVTLVGVLNADSSMHVPDFRAAERTYQLLEQVAGRAGRGPAGGHVVVQTYWPDHPAVQALVTRRPALLYDEERMVRQELGFPPYARIANIGFSGSDLRDVRSAATTTAEALRAGLPDGLTIVGPAPAPIERIKGNWRWHMLVKGPPRSDVAGALAPLLAKVAPPEGVTRVVDIDPAGML